MLSQIVCALLEKQDDFEVVLELDDRDELAGRLAQAGPDVVVMAGSDAATPAHVDRLLQEHPRVRVFILTPNGRDAFRVELRPETVPIREISSRRLVQEIRAAGVGARS